MVASVATTKVALNQMKYYCSSIIPTRLLETINHKKQLLWHMNNSLKNMHPKQIRDWLNQAESYFEVKPDNIRTLLNWNEIRKLSAENIDFGSHGLSHSILTVLSATEKHHELYESKRILSEKDINFVPVLSFPDGKHDQEVIDIAERVGYKMLLTASLKKCGDGHSDRLFHRINLSNRSSVHLNHLWIRLALGRLTNRL